MSLYSNIGGGYGGNTSTSVLPHMEAMLTKLGLDQALNNSRQVQQTPQRTIINDLDEIFADLTTEQRKAIETNEDYVNSLGALLQKFLFFLISSTPDGTNFIIGPGRKQAQTLLDTTKRIASNLDQVVKDNYQAMSERMAQLEAIIAQQNLLAEQRDKQLKEQQDELDKFKTTLSNNSNNNNYKKN